MPSKFPAHFQRSGLAQGGPTHLFMCATVRKKWGEENEKLTAAARYAPRERALPSITFVFLRYFITILWGVHQM